MRLCLEARRIMVRLLIETARYFIMQPMVMAAIAISARLILPMLFTLITASPSNVLPKEENLEHGVVWQLVLMEVACSILLLLSVQLAKGWPLEQLSLTLTTTMEQVAGPE